MRMVAFRHLINSRALTEMIRCRADWQNADQILKRTSNEAGLRYWDCFRPRTSRSGSRPTRMPVPTQFIGSEAWTLARIAFGFAHPATEHLDRAADLLGHDLIAAHEHALR